MMQLYLQGLNAAGVQGFGAAWHLAKVEVINTNTGEAVRTSTRHRGCDTSW